MICVTDIPTPSKSPEQNTVLSGRSFGAEADGAGRGVVAGRRWLSLLRYSELAA